MNNLLEGMAKELNDAKDKLANVENQLEAAKSEVSKPFPKETELNEKLEKLAELNSLLNMDKKAEKETIETEETHTKVYEQAI